MRSWHFNARNDVILLIIVFLFFYLLLYLQVDIPPTSEIVIINSTSADQQKVTRRVFLNRQKRIYDTCVENDDGIVQAFYTFKPKHLAYCPVAKVGSTFWKRILLFLHNDTNGLKVNHPFEIPRMLTHYGPRRSMKSLHFDTTSRPSLYNLTRFIFVRDPYSRLWSAYLDKFFLPDFWRTYAKNIILRRPDPTLKATLCQHDVTFQEFLSYIVDLGHAPEVLNEHWRPIQHICNPCQFRPHLIGKQESFGQEVRFILKYFGMEDLIPSYNHNLHVKEELKMLINYNYKLINQKHYYGCITNSQLATKLWTVFEFNGYLPLGSGDVLSGLSNVTKKDFTDLVLGVYEKTRKSAKEWSRQRLQAMTVAYKSVPNEIITGIKQIFKMDFKHFNYNEEPPGKRVHLQN